MGRWDVKQQRSLENISGDVEDACHEPLYCSSTSPGCREQEADVDGTRQPAHECFNEAVLGFASHDGHREVHSCDKTAQNI